jgi:hypothetical protein
VLNERFAVEVITKCLFVWHIRSAPDPSMSERKRGCEGEDGGMGGMAGRE